MTKTNIHKYCEGKKTKMNKLLIVGRLTKDPEAGSTPSEVTYSSLFVAVDKEGREGANFIPVKL